MNERKYFAMLMFMLTMLFLAFVACTSIDDESSNQLSSSIPTLEAETISLEVTQVSTIEIPQLPTSTPNMTPIVTLLITATDLPIEPPIEVTMTTHGADEEAYEVQHSGVIRLYSSLADPQRSGLDLDSGKVVESNNPEADIEFYKSVGTMEFYFVKTVNEAKAQAYPFSNLSRFTDCWEHLEELTSNLIPNYMVSSICVLTNEGRLGLLDFRRENLREGEDWVDFDVTTWSEVVINNPTN